MSKWSKTREVEGHKVEFMKIKNRKLSKIFYTIAFSMGNGGGGTAPSAPSETELFEKLNRTEDLDWIKDLFFENMFIEGMGNIGEKYEEIFDREDIDITLDFQLFSTAMEVYLSSFSNGKPGDAQQ